MITFAMRGNRQPQVHASYSTKQLEIKGLFHLSGPQIVGGEGGAPQWVADVLEAHPEIETIAVNYNGRGACFSRMSRKLKMEQNCTFYELTSSPQNVELTDEVGRMCVEELKKEPC